MYVVKFGRLPLQGPAVQVLPLSQLGLVSLYGVQQFRWLSSSTRILSKYTEFSLVFQNSVQQFRWFWSCLLMQHIAVQMIYLQTFEFTLGLVYGIITKF